MIRRFLHSWLFLCLTVSSAALAETDDAFNGKTDIPIHPMMDFNFKSKQEIYDLRTQFMTNYPQFADSSYKPSESVFGQIQDGKPWWGILGLSYYGTGQQSIAGPSEESQFIANPFMLVGLDRGHGVAIKSDTLSPVPVYPIPLDLMWSNDRKIAAVKYDMTSYWAGEKRIQDPLRAKQMVTLVAYNARDLGFNFLYVSPAESKNVTAAHDPVPILQFIHTGGSCGYPGGCNNMSPYQDGLEIKVEALPALAYIKLWKNAPASPESPADMVFLVQMI